MDKHSTKTFNDLYAHELRMLISAEDQMIAVLPQFAAATDVEELQTSLLTQIEPMNVAATYEASLGLAILLCMAA